ncbi:MAG: FAD-dependent thymidylate synthase [Eubacteriaceae bacterium]|nr:FAD-dependent thymidylate synthase [Eubacteriaceae bacterium]
METSLHVNLIAHTPEPEKVIAAAAKLCYSHAGTQELLDDLTPEKAEGFLKKLMTFGHASPLEHASFTFGIEGVSRALTHQLVRHRLASYSQKSQRYVTEGQFDYVVPPEIKAVPDAEKIYIKAMKDAQAAYDAIAEKLADGHYITMINKGADEKTARRNAEKKAIEDARFVLPNACETKIVVTMNVRELLHFFENRCCNRAQWEIRECATQMLKLCKQTAPTLFANAGPGCVRGACPEGAMSCGQAKAVREKFLHLS